MSKEQSRSVITRICTAQEWCLDVSCLPPNCLLPGNHLHSTHIMARTNNTYLRNLKQQLQRFRKPDVWQQWNDLYWINLFYVSCRWITYGPITRLHFRVLCTWGSACIFHLLQIHLEIQLKSPFPLPWNVVAPFLQETNIRGLFLYFFSSVYWQLPPL